MENNTNEKNQNKPNEKPKKEKRKGPIRTEAVLPLVIILALIAAYFTFFFDHNLRKGLEWVGTKANGAEVNIGGLKTSFLKASLNIHDIEVTDPALPAQNRVQIGNINFKLSWDALLRAKFVVDLAGMTGIQLHSPRARPGKVYPPEPSESMATTALTKLKSQFSESSLGDVAKYLEGFDPTKNLKDLGKLKSAARVEELQADLTRKEAEWTSKLNSLPSDKDFAQLQAKLNGIQLSSKPNPAEVTGKINEVKGILNEGQAKISSVESLSSGLTSDINGFSKSVGSIDDLAKEDLKGIESQLKLPSIDAKDLAKQLFGPNLINKLEEAQHYIAVARQHMPPKKKEAKKPEVVVHPRAKGKVYEFGRLNAYPTFWVKRMEVSSTGQYSALGGDMKGEILNISSNPAMVGTPIVANLEGNFQKQQIQDIALKITVDHRTDKPEESFEATVGSFPVADRMLSQSDSLTFGLANAKGKATLKGLFSGDQINFKMDSAFRNVDYKISAQSKLLESTLQSVVKELPTVTMLAEVKGPWSGPSISIDSNLALALQNGLAKQLQAKLAEARAKINALVQEKIGAKKAELTGKFDALKTRYTAQIDEKKKQAEGFKKLADNKINEIKNKAAAAPAQKALEGVRKKLPF